MECWSFEYSLSKRIFIPFRLIISEVLSLFNAVGLNSMEFWPLSSIVQVNVLLAILWVNSLQVRNHFYSLLIAFANSLDPDQARQNSWPDLDLNSLTF